MPHAPEPPPNPIHQQHLHPHQTLNHERYSPARPPASIPNPNILEE